jgi:hypothetical protein
MSEHEITFDANLSEPVRTRADFTYKITPDLIAITDTGLGSRSVLKDIEALLRKIEYWHQGSIAKLKIMSRDGKGFWHCVRWDGKAASPFPLEETDERRAGKKLFTED